MFWTTNHYIVSHINISHPQSSKTNVEDKEKRRFKEKGFRSTAFRSANHLLAKCVSYNRDNNFDCKEVFLLPSSLLHPLYPLYLLYQTLPLFQVKQIQVSFSFFACYQSHALLPLRVFTFVFSFRVFSFLFLFFIPLLFSF